MAALKEFAVVMLAACFVALVIESEGKPVIKKLDEQSMRAIDELAKQINMLLKPNSYYDREALAQYEEDSYYMIVLKALKSLDPSGAKEVATKSTNVDKSLFEYMEQIRAPCSSFLEQVDPQIGQYRAKYYAKTEEGSPEQFAQWHFYKQSCVNVLDDWDRVLEGAKEVYKANKNWFLE